jgi:hypothetical protein
MADQFGPRGKLLRGAREIAPLVYPKLSSDNPLAAIRKLYNEWRRYPIFQLGDDTELLTLEDRLLSFLEARSAAAEVAAELAAPAPKAVPPPPPKARPRRRARSPANEAA